MKQLNPGPSGEDLDEVEQPRDVGSLGSAPVRAGLADIGAQTFSHTPRQGWSAPLARTQRIGKQE
jgi:hypothetical protein